MGDVRTKANLLLHIQEADIGRDAVLHDIKTHRSMRKAFEECLKCLSETLGYDSDILVAVDNVMSMLGAKADVWGGVDNKDGAVLEMMETEDGVIYCRSTVRLESVASAQTDIAPSLGFDTIL